VTGASLKPVINSFLKKAKAGGYVAINAYLPRNGEMIDALQSMRVAIRAKTGNAVTAGFGPRFQHSTGQFHKGGIKDGLFLVITAEPEKDFAIPTEGLTFGALIRAQALGDAHDGANGNVLDSRSIGQRLAEVGHRLGELTEHGGGVGIHRVLLLRLLLLPLVTQVQAADGERERGQSDDDGNTDKNVVGHRVSLFKKGKDGD